MGAGHPGDQHADHAAAAKAARRRDPPGRRGVSAQGSAPEAEPPPGPTRQLRIFERQRDGQPYFDYQLDLKGFPEGILVAESPAARPGPGWRTSTASTARSRTTGRVRGATHPIRRDLRTYGGMLYWQLFPEKLQAQLWEKRNQITSIQVVSTEPFIPWELVYIKKPGQGVSAAIEVPGPDGAGALAARLPPRAPPAQRAARPRLLRDPPLRRRNRHQAATQAQARAQFLVDRFDARAVDPTLASVNKLLEKRGAFDLLHFACHGAGEPGDVLGGRVLLQSGHYDSQQRRFAPRTRSRRPTSARTASSTRTPWWC